MNSTSELVIGAIQTGEPVTMTYSRPAGLDRTEEVTRKLTPKQARKVIREEISFSEKALMQVYGEGVEDDE